MEKHTHQEYRDDLAKDLKNIPDHQERRVALEEEKSSKIRSVEYNEAKKAHVEEVNTQIEKRKLEAYEKINGPLPNKSEITNFIKDSGLDPDTISQEEYQKLSKELESNFVTINRAYQEGLFFSWEYNDVEGRLSPMISFLRGISRREEQGDRLQLDNYDIASFVRYAEDVVSKLEPFFKKRDFEVGIYARVVNNILYCCYECNYTFGERDGLSGGRNEREKRFLSTFERFRKPQEQIDTEKEEKRLKREGEELNKKSEKEQKDLKKFDPQI